MDKKVIKEKILEEIKKTEKNLENLKKQAQPISPENAIGRISRMDAINNKSIVDNAIRKDEEKMGKLKVALQKVDTKEFGICIKCKQEIPLGRIMLMPQALKCVKCA